MQLRLPVLQTYRVVRALAGDALVWVAAERLRTIPSGDQDIRIVQRTLIPPLAGFIIPEFRLHG